MSLGLRVEDRLDGQTNYSIWKERMQSIFEEAEVRDMMVHTTQNPVVVPTDATQLVEYNKKNNKGKRLILDGIKNHCIPNVRGKAMPMRCGQHCPISTRVPMRTGRWS